MGRASEYGLQGEKMHIPEQVNYLAAFLTFRCSMSCPYCINRYGGLSMNEYEMSTQEWIETLNKIPASEERPISLQGGEPLMRTDFYEIIQNSQGPFDLLTNGQFDPENFIARCSPDMFRKSLGRDTDAWFSSIRVSYHVRHWDTDNQEAYDNRIVRVVKMLQDAGYKIGITSPDHPNYQDKIGEFESRCKQEKIKFQRKEFLGYAGGKLYGTFKYATGLSGNLQDCKCRGTELLVAPDGMTYRCHRDLYLRQQPTGHILASNFEMQYTWRDCANFGDCNPCDLKLKTNRFGEGGHCSVEVSNFKNQYKPRGFTVGSTCSMSVGG